MAARKFKTIIKQLLIVYNIQLTTEQIYSKI